MGRPRTRILSPAIIAAAALEMVAEQRDFTIPGVAARLGVHPSSLYHHLPGGRRAIVDRMREELYSGIELAPLLDASVPALDRLAAWMRAYRAATARVPAVIPVLVGAPVDDLRTLEVYEALFEILRDAAVPADRRVDCSAMIDAVVLGSAIDAASPAPLWQPGAADVPVLREAATHDDAGRSDRGFELALEAVIAAIERLAAA